VIYNVFEQEPAAELLPAATECNVGVIVRVVFDEGVLTGKYTKDSTFPPDDFRSTYFAGDRLARAVGRAEKIRQELEGTEYSLPQAALQFALGHPAVSTVIPGIRNVAQAEANVAAAELPGLPEELLTRLRSHAWLRGVWYGGK
jgi:aryl-alcohol dehydrogenase-like predicted oxidoreductase